MRIITHVIGLSLLIATHAGAAHESQEPSLNELNAMATQLTHDEKEALTLFINHKIHVSSHDEKEYYQNLQTLTARGRAIDVIKIMQANGNQLEEIMPVKGLREKLLGGHLASAPLCLIKIAALPTLIFASEKKKALYLNKLSKCLVAEKDHIPSDILFTATHELIGALKACKVTAIFAQLVHKAIERLEALEKLLS